MKKYNVDVTITAFWIKEVQVEAASKKDAIELATIMAIEKFDDENYEIARHLQDADIATGICWIEKIKPNKPNTKPNTKHKTKRK